MTWRRGARHGCVPPRPTRDAEEQGKTSHTQCVVVVRGPETPNGPYMAYIAAYLTLLRRVDLVISLYRVTIMATFKVRGYI